MPLNDLHSIINPFLSTNIVFGFFPPSSEIAFIIFCFHFSSPINSSKYLGIFLSILIFYFSSSSKKEITFFRQSLEEVISLLNASKIS